LIELLFYNGKKDFVFSWFFRIFCIAPVVLCFTYLLYKNWNFDLVYARRDFSLEERLMTQARALCDYVYLILVPQTIGSGLIHDDFRVSRSLIEPLTTIFSLGAVGAAILLSFLVKKRYPLLAFGVLFFLAGHSLESTFLPLENYFEHRNYLPMVGVLLVIVFILNALVSNLSKKLAIGLSAMVCTFYFIFASLLTSQNTRVWSNTFDLLTIWATEHPDSLRAQRIYGQFLGKTDMWHYEGADVLLDAYQKFPRDIGLLIAAANISCKHGYDKPIVELQHILDELNKPEKLARFNGGLLTIVENFGDLYLVGKCDTEANQRVVDQILTSLVGLSGFNAGTRAELSVYHSETFAKRGDLDGAIRLLDEAFNYQRASVIPVQQAIYFSSAGLYDEALERLDVAIKINQDRSSIEVFDSASDHLLRMQNDIKSAKQRITVE
jgi:tetratricopeptide (TPR) repeat protein